MPVSGLGIRSFAHFAQIKWAPVSNSLRSLTNERLWANRSGRSEEMSDSERIAQVAQDKWATLSDSLRSLKKRQRKWANERFAQKNLPKKSKILFLVCFIYDFKKRKKIEKWVNRSFFLISSFLLSNVSDLLTMAHFFWAMWANCSGRSPKMSDVSKSLTKNEQPWAIRSGCSPKMSD